MTQTDADPIEVETSTPPDATIVWLHGLGVDGHDFEPIAQEIGRPATRFLFPHAPLRPVTLNGGARMRAWFDLYGLGADARQDEAGIEQATQYIHGLIRAEQRHATPARRVILAGFSQGGALALHAALHYPEQIGGVIALSTYLPLHATRNAGPVPHPGLPVFMAHGVWDPVIGLEIGRASMTHLRGLGLDVEWQSYPMGHTVISDEVGAIRGWLDRTLPRAA